MGVCTRERDDSSPRTVRTEWPLLTVCGLNIRQCSLANFFWLTLSDCLTVGNHSKSETPDKVILKDI